MLRQKDTWIRNYRFWVGTCREELGLGGNRISYLGEPEQENDAVRLHFVNGYFLRRDGAGWMRNDLSLGGHKVTGISNPEADQGGVNKRTLKGLM